MTVEFEEVEHEFSITYDVVVNRHWSGELVQEIDGFYVYYPNPKSAGAYSEWFLRAVADKLQELNREYNDTLSGHGEHNAQQGESL